MDLTCNFATYEEILCHKANMKKVTVEKGITWSLAPVWNLSGDVRGKNLKLSESNTIRKKERSFKTRSGQ